MTLEKSKWYQIAQSCHIVGGTLILVRLRELQEKASDLKLHKLSWATRVPWKLIPAMF